MNDSESVLLSQRDAAKLCGLSERTMQDLRKTRGLPHVRIGTRVLYKRDDLMGWIGEQTVTPSGRLRASGPRVEHAVALNARD